MCTSTGRWRETKRMAISEISSAATQQQEPSLFPRGNFLPFFLVTALFFLWGVPNNLNDVLIRQFMKSFEINRFQAGLIQSAFYAGYFVLAIPAGLIMRRLGYKAGFIIGLTLFGTGAFCLARRGVWSLRIFLVCAICNCQRPFVWKLRPIRSSLNVVTRKLQNAA